MRAGRTQESTVPGFDIEVPDVTLVNQNGEQVNLRFLLDSDMPVIIDFISTTCSSICSDLSAGFSGLRDRLGEASRSVQLVSISIDPEHDGPQQMKDYLKSYNAGKGWDFLTGTREEIVSVLKAFKFNPPVQGKITPGLLFIAGGPYSHSWVRVNGMVGADGLMTEVKRMRNEMAAYYYMAAKISGAVSDYEEYIRRFPDGEHLQEIEALLGEAEASSYAKAEHGKEYYACKEYLSMFPNGRHADEIRALLKKSYDTMMEFIFVKGGCYPMGDSFGVGGKNERIVHEVCVDDFLMGKYDVTRGDFEKFVDDTGYVTEAEKGGGCYDWSGRKYEGFDWKHLRFPQDDRHPVVCVSWNDAVAFAQWLSAKTGKPYRLPTEAEWEYAARSGGKDEKFAGISDQNELHRYANFCDKSCVFVHSTRNLDDGHKFTSPVGSYLPNGLGLYDMTGNVLQWVSDWYDDMYYRDSPKDNPKGPDSGQYRMLRGGSWYMNPLYTRAAYRTWGTPAVRFDDIGFRLVSPIN